jgi:hypothetical protein
MHELNEEDRLANLRISQAHPAGIPRLLIHDHSSNPGFLQLLVTLREERRKRFSTQRDELKRLAHSILCSRSAGGLRRDGRKRVS